MVVGWGSTVESCNRWKENSDKGFLSWKGKGLIRIQEGQKTAPEYPRLLTNWTQERRAEMM